MLSVAPHITARPRPSERETSVARARLADALVRTGNDDRHALHEVYALTSAKLFGICLRVCGEPQAAEDVLHEVYLTIWQRAAAWNPARGAAITWLAAVARNRAIDWRRANRKMCGTISIDHASSVADPAVDAETALLSVESARHVRACLETLDPRHRAAIRAAFFDGATYVELAERHGVPLGTMKSWVRRGLAKMGGDLQQIEADVAGNAKNGPHIVMAYS